MSSNKDYADLAFRVYLDTIEEKKKAFNIQPGELVSSFARRCYHARLSLGFGELSRTIVELEECYGNRWIWYSNGIETDFFFKDEADFIQFKITYPCIHSSIPAILHT